MVFHRPPCQLAKAGPAIPAQFRRHAPSEIIGQHLDIALPHPQRGQGHDFEAEPVQKVGAEFSGLDHIGQMFVGCRNDAYIDAHGTRGTDAGYLAIFHRAQQPLLRTHAERAELVEEQRPPVRLFKAPLARTRGTRKRPCLMPEQFRFDQGFRQGGAVHRHQRPVPARAQAVQALGDQFLTRPPFANHQHRPVQRRGTAGTLYSVEKGGRLSDKLMAITLHF